MYIGSTDTRKGLMHCLWEIIDNAASTRRSYIGARAHHIERRRCTADGSVEVYDDGRGIPVDKEPKTGLPGVEVVFTKLHAGGKFGGGSYVATGGLHGVGASVVNALSAGSTSTSTGRPRRPGDVLPPRAARRLRRRRPEGVLRRRSRA
jgi:DNA gyrase subunit B